MGSLSDVDSGHCFGYGITGRGCKHCFGGMASRGFLGSDCVLYI